MILVLVGPPGAGKGTQADLLVANNGYRKLSTGDALRKHIKNKSPIGEKAASIMARGELVPDEVLFSILKEELGSNKQEVVLLDGYPRNVDQARALKEFGKDNPIIGAIHIDVDSAVLVDRLAGRLTCTTCSATYHSLTNPSKDGRNCDRCGEILVQRPDDEKSKVQVRLNVYDEATKPVLDFYKAENLYFRVDGFGKTDEVFSRLQSLVSSIVKNSL